MSIETAPKISKNYYEQKGYVRHMVIVPEVHKLKLKQIAKKYAITQGEVIEVMLNQIDVNQDYNIFAAKRLERLGDRKSTVTALTKKIKNLNPEQLAAIEAIIAQAGG